MAVIQVARNPDYKDLDLDFFKSPATSDVVKKKGHEAVKRSIRNLVLTNFYDRPFRSHIGSNAPRLLFEPINGVTLELLRQAIIEVIENFEPRCRLAAVDVVSEEKNGYTAIIHYTLNNESTPTTLRLFLERIR